MIINLDDHFDNRECRGCHQSLSPYRYESVMWNGDPWHVWCALTVADRILEESNINAKEVVSKAEAELLQKGI